MATWPPIPAKCGDGWHAGWWWSPHWYRFVVMMTKIVMQSWWSLVSKTSIHHCNKSLPIVFAYCLCLLSLLLAFGSSCKVNLPGERVLEVQESVAPGWNQELWPTAWKWKNVESKKHILQYIFLLHILHTKIALANTPSRLTLTVIDMQNRIWLEHFAYHFASLCAAFGLALEAFFFPASSYVERIYRQKSCAELVQYAAK